jgi:hypothetical protein
MNDACLCSCKCNAIKELNTWGVTIHASYWTIFGWWVIVLAVTAM